MALMDTLRLRNILVRGEVAKEAPADEIVGALDEEMAAATEHFVTKDSHEASENRVLAAIADSDRRAAERDAARTHEAAERDREAAERDAARAREAEQRAREAAERDRQIHNHITIGIGLIIGAITIATAVISIVIVVLD